MIRNVLWFLGGVVVLFGGLMTWPKERTLLLSAIGVAEPRALPSPGSGSNIRVVGGSIKVKIGKYDWSVDSATQLVVSNADAQSFELENVSAQMNGAPTDVTYPNLGPSWTIDDITQDMQGGNHGVEIQGSAGNGPGSGSATFTPIPSGDTFVPANDGNAKDRKYHDQHCMGDPQAKCDQETVTKILVTVGGAPMPDIWYCADKSGHCHVDIGDQP